MIPRVCRVADSAIKGDLVVCKKDCEDCQIRFQCYTADRFEYITIPLALARSWYWAGNEKVKRFTTLEKSNETL